MNRRGFLRMLGMAPAAAVAAAVPGALAAGPQRYAGGFVKIGESPVIMRPGNFIVWNNNAIVREFRWNRLAFSSAVYDPLE